MRLLMPKRRSRFRNPAWHERCTLELRVNLRVRSQTGDALRAGLRGLPVVDSGRGRRGAPARLRRGGTDAPRRGRGCRRGRGRHLHARRHLGPDVHRRSGARAAGHHDGTGRGAGWLAED